MTVWRSRFIRPTSTTNATRADDAELDRLAVEVPIAPRRRSSRPATKRAPEEPSASRGPCAPTRPGHGPRRASRYPPARDLPTARPRWVPRRRHHRRRPARPDDAPRPAAELGHLAQRARRGAGRRGGAGRARRSPVGDHRDVEAVASLRRRVRRRHLRPRARPRRGARGPRGRRRARAPEPAALLFAQDKLAMRERLDRDRRRLPRVGPGPTAADVERRSATQIGWPVVAKTPARRLRRQGRARRLLGRRPRRLAGRRRRRRPSGAARGRPAARGEGRLRRASSPSSSRAAPRTRPPPGRSSRRCRPTASAPRCSRRRPDLDPDLAAVATEAALRIAGELGVTGVLAVEMFEVTDPETGSPAYVVNELAMRPHNSGHWTMDGAVTGQFEQHLRAVLDLPLGDPRPDGAVDRHGQRPRRRLPATSTRPTGTSWRATPALKVHLYGKGVRPGRKIGHVNVSGTDLDDAARARRARGRLPPRSDHRMSDLQTPTREQPRRRHRHGQRQRLARHGAAAAGARGVRDRRTRPTSSRRTGCPTR